jgi:hypothetical protein
MSAAASDYCILVVSYTRLPAGYVIGQLNWLLLFPLDRLLSDWGCSPEDGITGRASAGYGRWWRRLMTEYKVVNESIPPRAVFGSWLVSALPQVLIARSGNRRSRLVFRS